MADHEPVTKSPAYVISWCNIVDEVIGIRPELSVQDLVLKLKVNHAHDYAYTPLACVDSYT